MDIKLFVTTKLFQFNTLKNYNNIAFSQYYWNIIAKTVNIVDTKITLIYTVFSDKNSHI